METTKMETTAPTLPKSCRVCNLVIETLSDECEALTTRVVELTSEKDCYRELALRSIAALHDLTAERDRQTDRIRNLCEEIRRYTAIATAARAA
jgi:hypothetical protein